MQFAIVRALNPYFWLGHASTYPNLFHCDSYNFAELINLASIQMYSKTLRERLLAGALEMKAICLFCCNRETYTNDVILDQRNNVCHFVTDNPRKAETHTRWRHRVPQRVTRTLNFIMENRIFKFLPCA